MQTYFSEKVTEVIKAIRVIGCRLNHLNYLNYPNYPFTSIDYFRILLSGFMKQVTIKDKTFGISISSEQIQKRVREIGEQLEVDLKGKNPLFIPVLNGAVLFFADLLKHVSVECEISFVRVSSYNGTQSTGVVKNILGLNDSIKGRTVVIVEDIVDSGNTMMHLIDDLNKQHPSEIKIITLLLKPDMLKHDIKLDYVGFEVPEAFLVGYGLDYDGLGRNLNDIYKLV